MDDDSSKAATSYFPGDGDMVRAVQAKDWGATLLGPVSGWPAGIRTAVSISLNSNFQISVLSGPGLVCIYNDATVPIFGDKHPWALGRPVAEVWPEAWPTIGPMLSSVMQTCRPTGHDDLLLVLNRAGFTEECYFTFSYSPIRADAHTTDGVFVTAMETTGRVFGERRQRTLNDLATQVALRRGDERTLELLCATLAANVRDVPLSALYLAEPGAGHAEQVFCTGLDEGCPGIDRRIPWPGAAGAHPLARLAHCSGPQLYAADQLLSNADTCGVWPEPPRQILALPFMGPGPAEVRGFLLVAVNPRAPLDGAYRQFIDAVGALAAAAVAGIDAVAAERRRAEAVAEPERSESQFVASDALRTPVTRILGPARPARADPALRREIAVVRHDLASVLERTSDAFLSLDAELRILALNEAAVFDLGPRRKLVGQRLPELVPDLAGSLLEQTMRATLAGARLETVEQFHPTSGRWFNVRCFPAQQGLIVFATDITERKKAEQVLMTAKVELELRVELRTEELRHANELLAAVFDRAPGGIAITGTDGRFVRANPAFQALVGYTEAQLAARGIADLIVPDDYRPAAGQRVALLDGDIDSCQTEVRFRRADGSVIWVHNFLSLIRDESRGPRYFVQIAQDISARKRVDSDRRAAQDQLNELYQRLQTVREAERTALAREVHDQLGQTLSAAKIDVKLLEDDIRLHGTAFSPEKIITELGSACATLDRAMTLVREIATELRAPELDGQGLYAAIEWHARDFERRTRIRVHVEQGAGLEQPSRKAAEALLRIFQESMTNVLRHARATNVWVSVERRFESLLLRVRDDGAGIARQHARTVRSLGITGMQERAALASGKLRVGPLKPNGTLVSALIPINRRAGA